MVGNTGRGGKITGKGIIMDKTASEDLREMEWSGRIYGGAHAECYVCHNPPEEGHSKSCLLASAIEKVEEMEANPAAKKGRKKLPLLENDIKTIQAFVLMRLIDAEENNITVDANKAREAESALSSLASAIAKLEADHKKYPFEIYCRGKTRLEWLERLEGLLPPEFGPVKSLTAKLKASEKRLSQIANLCEDCNSLYEAQIIAWGNREHKTVDGCAKCWVDEAEAKLKASEKRVKALETVAKRCLNAMKGSNCNEEQWLREILK